MRVSLGVFAGLLDRSVDEIWSLAVDARGFDASRIGQIADIWDNNTGPLVAAAVSGRAHRDRLAEAALEWTAALGPARRALMVDLDPALDQVLPAAAPGSLAYRDYRGRVCPGELPLTAQTIADLAADYDLPAASIRLLTAEQRRSGLQVRMTVAAPRQFTPTTGCVRTDGSVGPWPAAELGFTFDDITALAFDSQDRHGVHLTGEPGADPAGIVMTAGREGHLRAGSGTVWPNDPCWDESAAGRAADTVTPHRQDAPERVVPRPSRTAEELAAGRALVELMWRIRMVRDPHHAARIPVDRLCQIAAGAGSSIVAAGRRPGPLRRRAFTVLAGRWQQVPDDRPPMPVPDRPLVLRYAQFQELHDDHGLQRDGSASVTAAIPQLDPTKPWTLAGEQYLRPTGFRIHLDAFNEVQHLRRRRHGLTIGDGFTMNSSSEQ